MKKMNITLLSIITAICMMAACNSNKKENGYVPLISNDSLIKKGAYLVGIMGCHDCHSPKVMTPQGPALDMDRLLSGHPANMPLMPFDTTTAKNWALFNMTNTAAIGPWGASFAGNITSDETGIGTWTEAQFRKALVEGKFKGMDGSRTLLPPMPWQNFKDVKDEDIRAIFAYLKSTRPVENIVPRALTPDMLGQYIR